MSHDSREHPTLRASHAASSPHPTPLFPTRSLCRRHAGARQPSVLPMCEQIPALLFPLLTSRHFPGQSCPSHGAEAQKPSDLSKSK